jgi:hypothetical protein
MRRKILAIFNSQSQRHQLMISMVFGVLLAGAVGGFQLLVHGATSVVTTEPENHTLSNKACLVNDASASSGKAVKFGCSSGATKLAPAVPADTGAMICGNSAVLSGPSTAPAGAVVVPAGNNSGVNLGQANTTYYFQPGVHTLGSGQYSQIIPGNNSKYIGAPGAIIDGQRINQYAFTQRATGVTIEYLTIRNFGSVGSNNNEGVVNHDSGHNWTIRYNTISSNAGAGMMIGAGNVISYNCVTQNEQYGFNAYEPAGPINVTIDHNEISFNNTYDWEAKVPGCGCTGGGKFWDVNGGIVTNNYVHDNKSVGIWADTNNRGFLFEGNYIANNDNVGLEYEISYNAKISYNTFIGNGIVAGPTNPGFPTTAIYLSESGSDSRVNTAYKDTLEVSNNVIKNNWGGVAIWENADRYCGSPANTSSSDCTMVNPSVITTSSCNATNIANAPYYNDCRWKSQNIMVHDNTFISDTSVIGAKCTINNVCAFNGIFSNWGTYPSWSPYKGTIVENAITYNQNNKFYNNTYQGTWNFMTREQGNIVNYTTWRAAPSSQDAGSTKN